MLIALRVISIVMLCGIVTCLIASCHNIYAYLYLRRINQILILAFYVALLLTIVMNVVTWTCSMIYPSFFAEFLYVSYTTEASSDGLFKEKRWLYDTLQTTCMVSSLSGYAMCWVVVATVIELSNSICVLSGNFSPKQMKRRRDLSYFATVGFPLAYSIAVIFSVSINWREDGSTLPLAWISLFAEVILASFYTTLVFKCLLPAIKRI